MESPFFLSRLRRPNDSHPGRLSAARVFSLEATPRHFIVTFGRNIGGNIDAPIAPLLLNIRASLLVETRKSQSSTCDY
jgi:hypothetical protein